MAYVEHYKEKLGEIMNGKNTKMNFVVEDLEFFVEYRNSLSPEELLVSTIDFEGLGIY